MKIYNRSTKTYTETEQYGAGKLQFLYQNPFGRLFLPLAVSPLVSRIYGLKNSSGRSVSRIAPFIEEYGIDTGEYEAREYRSFNDFFTRKLREGARPIGDGFISPADSKLLAYEIGSDTKLSIKGRDYEVSELTGRDISGFENGYALVFRLCMDDCHRYCFPCPGRVTDRYMIRGKLHTVSPFSNDHRIYKENTRQISLLDTEGCGKIVYIEVGAILVGCIRDNGLTEFNKGDEKGYFEIGGSTIVLLLNGNFRIDDDIMEQSREGIETQVRYGETIGRFYV